MYEQTRLEIYSPTVVCFSNWETWHLNAHNIFKNENLRLLSTLFIYVSYRVFYRIFILFIHTSTSVQKKEIFFLFLMNRKKEIFGFSFNIRFHRYAQIFSLLWFFILYSFYSLPAAAGNKVSVVEQITRIINNTYGKFNLIFDNHSLVFKVFISL